MFWDVGAGLEDSWGCIRRLLGSLGGALEASWNVLGGSVLGGLLGHPRSSRRPKTAQDHCKAYKDGFTLAGRAQRASERSERSERSDQDETELAEHKRRRRNSNGVAGATGSPRGLRNLRGVGLVASWRHLEMSWGRLGRSWGCPGVLLDVLKMSWKAIGVRICWDVDRNLRSIKTMKTDK